MAIKVILLDIDGTLTNSKKEMTPETRNALLKAQEHGAVLVLASGRTPNGLKRYAEELDLAHHNGLLVASNGGEVINCETGETLFRKAMSVQEAKAVLEHIKQFEIVPMVAKGEYMYVPDVFNNTIIRDGKPFPVMQYEARSNNYMLCEVKDMAEWCSEPVVKILTFGQPEYLQEHYREIGAPFDYLSHMFTSAFYYEFTAQGVDKTKAIKESLIKLGYKQEEMIAFGDGHNDRSMVEFAGIGVAMGNAVEDLKKAADDVTADNEHDGIALSLYKYMPEVFG